MAPQSVKILTKRAAARKPKRLTDAMVRDFPKAPPGQRYAISDSACPGLRLRITSAGTKSFLLWRPMASGKWCTRFLGEFPGMTVDEARIKARAWLALLAAGKDPAVEAAREKQARKDRCSFEQATEDFIAEKVMPTERKGPEIAREIRNDLIPVWGKRPLAEITRRDVIELLHKKKQTAPEQARNLLVLVKRMFSWFVGMEIYGLEASPCSEIKARNLFGAKVVGHRTLSDDELRALWHVADALPFPYREIYLLLMLNPLRLNELVDASKPEFSFADRDWTIGRERMKGTAAAARSFLVPLTSSSLEILGQMPNLEGPFLFSLNGGETSVWCNDKIKSRIDKAMLAALKAMAAERGDDPEKVVLENWTNHDVRRSIRTNMSKLRDRRGHRFSEEIKEACLSHKPTGLTATYDKHDFSDEKLECLEAWSARLKEITTNSTDKNVIFMPGVKRA